MRKSFFVSVSFLALIVASPGGASAASPVLPTAGAFAVGAGTISTAGSTETVKITSGTSGAPTVINWSGYSIGAGDTVAYTAPSNVSTVVNIDNSGTASSIAGTISSPNIGQVVVNPDGINVAGTAVLPEQFLLAAGTYDKSTQQITANSAPVTIAAGATMSANGAAPPSQISVIEASGDTLPDTNAATALGDAGTPYQASSGVPIEINGSNPTFATQPGQVGSLMFTKLGGGNPGVITLISPTNAAAAGNLNLQIPWASGTGPTNSGTGTDTISVPSGGYGSITLDGIDSAGFVNVTSPGGVTIEGQNTADAGLNVLASVLSVGAVGLDQYAPADSSQTTLPTLTIANNATITTAGTGNGGVSLQGDNVNLVGQLNTNTESINIISNQPMTPPSSSFAGVFDTNINAKYIGISAPSVENISLYNPNPSATGNAQNGYTEPYVGITSNTVNNDILTTAGQVSISTPTYLYAPGNDGYQSPSQNVLNIDNSIVASPSGGAPIDLKISSFLGTDINGMFESAPTSGQVSYLNISGGSSVPGNTLYTPKGVTSQNLTITNSTLYGTGTLSTDGSLPGNVTITGSTIEGDGALGGSAPHDTTIAASNGGTVSIDATSKVSTNMNYGSGGCTGTGADCTTNIDASTINYSSGNQETASGANDFASSSTITGTPNSTPAATSSASSSDAGTINLDAPGGTVTVAGYIDAGHPGSTGGGSTGGGSTGGGSTGPAGPAGPAGPQGPQGPVGPEGPQGPQGPQGVGISTTSINSSGDLIITLTNGVVTNLGQIVGSKGATGASGPQGPQGPQGIPGSDGVGISTTSINSAGDLIITLTNGVVKNTGKVVGPAGPAGVGISTTSINSLGDLIITLTNGTITNVGDVIGATGPQGPQGAPGADGVGISSTSITLSGDLVVTLTNGTVTNLGKVVGPAGPAGADGATGATGPAGSGISTVTINSTGDLVVTLTNGVVTNLGRVVGPAGPTGANGATGATGATGPAGPAGPPGAPGVGVSLVAISGSGHLIVTLTDGVKIDAGSVGLIAGGAAEAVSVTPIVIQPSSRVDSVQQRGDQVLVPPGGQKKKTIS